MADRFAFETSLLATPVATYTAIQILGALIFSLLCWRLVSRPLHSRGILAGILICGLVLRCVFLGSEPVLESDFYRYLWDGATTVAGYNPWTWSPAQVLGGEAPKGLQELALFSSPVVERINHSQLTTIYPPTAQAFFALSAWLNPLDLDTWRLLLFGADTVSCLLLLALLKHLGRPTVWIAIWWLNPLVIKEVMNTAHVDVLLVPLVLGSVLAMLRGHRYAAAVCIIAATGVKLWPAMLALWLFKGNPLRCWIAGGFTGLLMLIAMAGPLVLFKSDATAGLVAYSSGWDTNAGVFAVVRALAAIVTADPDLLARLVTAITLLIVLTRVSWQQTEQSVLFVQQIATAIFVLLLLSPAVYPWYVLWIAPFIALIPRPSMVALVVLVSLYYLRFHFAPRDAVIVFSSVVAVVEFVPVVLLFAVEVWRGRWNPGKVQ